MITKISEDDSKLLSTYDTCYSSFVLHFVLHEELLRDYHEDLSKLALRILICQPLLQFFFFLSLLLQPFWWQRANINRSTQFPWVFLRLLFAGWRQVQHWKGRRYRPYCMLWHRKLSPGGHDIASWGWPRVTARKADPENQHGSGGCEVFKSYSHTRGGEP